MTSDNVKAGIYLVTFVALSYVAFKGYEKFKGLANTQADTGEKIAKALSALGSDFQNSIDNVKGGVRKAMGLPVNDYVMPDIYGARLVNFSQWPRSSKAAIDMIKKKRGEKVSSNSNDYLGWQVFSDGTIISPSDEYMTDQIASGMYSDDAGTVVTPIGIEQKGEFIAQDSGYDLFSYNPFVTSKLLPNMSDNIPY